MKAILLQDVKNLGQANDLVDVAEGYGRNYLIPRGLAVEATRANMQKREREKKRLDAKRQREEAEARETAAQLAEQTVVVKVKAGEGGRLFGSVTSSDIAEQLERQAGIVVDRRRIELDEPLKTVGTYDIPVRLHQGVEAQVRVELVEES